jgi:biofilm PGA synthesis N-glycosyltransferase PgaC
MLILTALFWTISALMFATYIGYPLVLVLFSPRNRADLAQTSRNDLRVTLIISARNEEKVIERKIENSLRLDYPALEITVVSDGSTDRTSEICMQYSPRINLIHDDVKRGKNEALNNALTRVDTDLIVFSDANCFYQPDAIQRLACHHVDPKVGCVVGNLQLKQTGTSDVGKGEGLYWRYEHMLKTLESRFGSLLVANGSIFSVRRELVGILDSDVANDFQIPLRTAARGYRVLYEPRAVAYEKTASNRREEFDRKVRIVNRGIRGAWRMRGYLTGFRLFEFVFHKLLRWFSGVALMFIFLISAVLSSIPFFLVLFLLQTGFYLLALAGHFTQSRRRIFYIPFYISLVNLAATGALIKVLLRKRYTSWEPPQTAR